MKKKKTRQLKKDKFYRNKITKHFSYVTEPGDLKTKSVALTHKPPKKDKKHYFKLKENPNKSDTKDSYLSTKERNLYNSTYIREKKDWKLSDSDKNFLYKKLKKNKKRR